MQVGDKVWIFDSNRRLYQDENGNRNSRPLYRGHFIERYILGETKQSWIIGVNGTQVDNRNNIKVNKKTLKYPPSFGLNGKLYTSEEDVNQACWIQDNRYNINEQVSRCNDYFKLKQIKEILDS